MIGSPLFCKHQSIWLCNIYIQLGVDLENVCCHFCPWSDGYFIVNQSFSWLIPVINGCGTGANHVFDLGGYARPIYMFSGSH